jgi:hypothetical protein
LPDTIGSVKVTLGTMRSPTRIVIGLLVCAAAAGAHAAKDEVAEARRRVASPDGKRVAEVRPRPRGGEAVWIDGKIGWPEGASKIAPVVTSGVVWSKRGDAVAFAARERTGVTRLVVVLVDAATDPVAITWPIPTGALPAREVMWLGPTRVGAGPAELQPRVVASFTTSER